MQSNFGNCDHRTAKQKQSRRASTALPRRAGHIMDCTSLIGYTGQLVNPISITAGLVPDALVRHYIATLGTYHGLYIPNWIY
ncbi:hypothetical protein BGY98DRAFT_474684 [Russula aff. rugulosa BPL654]|nr:hypothetical protein BGY98DRAFT_474684 [Russula aff. rugulosa BPL654]